MFFPKDEESDWLEVSALEITEMEMVSQYESLDSSSNDDAQGLSFQDAKKRRQSSHNISVAYHSVSKAA